MKVKQEIILSYYRNGYSIRKISRELGINRKTITRYVKAYESQRNPSSPLTIKIRVNGAQKLI